MIFRKATGLITVLLMLFIGFSAVSSAGGATVASAARTISVTVKPHLVRNTISHGIYSQFLEHIYHSADNGIWGELIWNRSFEEPLSSPGGEWLRKGNEIRQLSLAANVRKAIGAANWSHYQLSVDAKKLGGAEGFMIYFYNHDGGHWFALNLGGWNNSRDALQRAGGNPGPGIIVSNPTMHIQRGRWYHIRLHCDGSHIQAWVNGRMLFDRIVRHGTLAGGVALGTWHTQAAYKNLVVKSLADGDHVLFQGLPPVRKISHLATRFWTRFGPGTVRRSTTDPRNSRICVKITSSTGETGVRQPDICLAAAGTYQGSLWVRDTTPHKVTIRLISGKTLLGQKVAGISSRRWRRISFAFNTRTAVHHAVLQIGFTGAGAAYLDQVSMMSDAARKLGGFRPDTLKALQALKPALIRWPGGGYSDSYHWMDGIGPQADRVSEGEIWDDMDPNALGTDEYMHLCRLTGAQPEICINIGPDKASAAVRSQYVQEACHWLEYCNAPATNKWGALRSKYGHPQPYNVKYWEIGNEIWWGRDGLNPRQYAKVLRLFVPAMKKLDPSIRIIACGGSGIDQQWNRQLLTLAPAGLFDYLSLHQYVPPNGFLTAAQQYIAFIRKTGQFIHTSASPHCKLFVSEWNAQCIDWRTGLFAGGILIGFEQQGSLVRLSTPALLLRWVRENSWNNAFINFNRCSWFPAPNYVVEKLWRDHFAKYRVGASNASPLEADATLTANRQTVYYKAVNPTAQSVVLKLTVAREFPVATATARTIAPGSLFAANSLAHPHRVRPHGLPVITSGQHLQLTLAPYSASVVTINRR